MKRILCIISKITNNRIPLHRGNICPAHSVDIETNYPVFKCKYCDYVDTMESNE